MKITDHISKSNKTLFSLEILPPLKGQNINDIFDNVEQLMEFNPPFIDVTYHREEYVYIKLPSGGYERRAVKNRPGTIGVCAALMHKYKVDTVPHILAGGFTVQETENILIDMQYLGIDNVLALRGDAIKGESNYHPKKGGHFYANEVVSQINNLNNGKYIDELIITDNPTNFDIGVAGYPEKHGEADSIESDMKFLKQKVDAGADYIVTQMFFENQKFFDFVKRCRDMGITIPIIPGLKPLSTLNHLTILPEFFNLEIPEELRNEVLKAKNKKAIRQIGVEWGIRQSRELIKFGVPVVHYYSMGKSDNVKQIAKAVF